jgi:hypothetical protein
MACFSHARLPARWIAAAALAVGTAQPALAQPFTKADASAIGKQLGTSIGPSIKQGITTANPAQVVPGYSGSNQSQASYFAGGMGSTVGPGAARVVGCNGQSDLECQAVNLLAKARQTRPQFQIANNDPLISKARALSANPGSQIGDIFSTYDTCKTATTTTPAIFDTQVCQEYSVNENKNCSIGQEVVVDPDYNYQCDRSPRRIDNLTCSRILRVTTTVTPSCNSGDVLTYASFGWGYDYRSGKDLYIDGGVVRAYCNFGGIELGLFRGNVVEGDYGSGAEGRPPPDPTRLPSLTRPVLSTSEPSARDLGYGVSAMGSCDSSNCNYQVATGGSFAQCPAGQGMWFDDGYGGVFFSSSGNGALSASCSMPSGAATLICDAYSNCYYQCPAGSTTGPLIDGQCYQQMASPSYTLAGPVMTLSFPRPRNIINVYEEWDNQCAGLEARSQ